MSKTVEIDLSGDRLIGIASDMVDDHNYIGALKMLNKNAEINGNDEDSYMLYAEIFDDLGLYEKSVHNWFKYMDMTDLTGLYDCYEGLAIGYMNLGNDHFSAYYYGKLLNEADDLDADTREQILQDFLSDEENPLKFSYPPEIADVSQIMNEGVGLMKSGEFAKAYKEFAKVAKGNPKWAAARNYMAMCMVVQDKNKQAQKLCESILKDEPNNVQALATLAAVKTETGERDEALSITRKLLTLDVTDADDLYKIATVCCENKLHAEAYSLFCRMDEDCGYDKNMLYFKAISAFNSKQYERCFEAFDKLLTIYPDAVTAQFYYRIARESFESGEWHEMSYFYTLPQEICQYSLEILATFLKLSKKQAAETAEQLNILHLVKWCFDEVNEKFAEHIRILAVQVAVKAGFDDYLRDILLHPFLTDELKMDVLTGLAERNSEDVFGAVICHEYKRISMRRLNIGRAQRIYFVRAYARLVGHFSIVDDDYGEHFALAAELLYARLLVRGTLERAKDVAALAAEIFVIARVGDNNVIDKNVCAFFGVTQQRLDKFRGE